MEQYRNKWAAATRLAAMAAVAVWAVSEAPLHATPASGFSAAQQWKGLYEPMVINGETDGFEVELRTKGNSDVYVTRNVIQPGGQSGWHTHPGPSLITVAVGEVTVYDGHDPLCTSTVYRVGEGFIDIGSGDVHLIKNETGSIAETVAVQFLEQGATRRTDVPKPNNCNF